MKIAAFIVFSSVILSLISCEDSEIYQKAICESSSSIKFAALYCIINYWTEEEEVNMGFYLDCLDLPTFEDILDLECGKKVSSEMFVSINKCKYITKAINIIRDPEPNLRQISHCMAKKLSEMYKTK